MDTNVHRWEIYYNNSSVWFAIDGVLVHTISSATTTYSNTLNLPIRTENINSGDSITNVTMEIRVATIYRLGNLETQPTSKYQAGTTAGVICKYGAGNLRGIIISGVVNNAQVDLYDNTAASGTLLWSSGAMTNQTVPFDLQFQSMTFSTGLTMVVSAANCNALVIYE
jgi:hypothetical protein